MLWTIAVILIILWMLGLGTNLVNGLFIHAVYAAAVALLVIGLSREVANNPTLRHVSRGRESKQVSKRRHKRSTDQSIPSRVPSHIGQISGVIP